MRVSSARRRLWIFWFPSRWLLMAQRVSTGGRNFGSVFKALHERGSILLDQLWDGLIDLDNVKLFGLSPAALRTPTLAFTVKDKPADQVCQRLAKRGIFASHGDFYATTVARRLGVGDAGFVRIGCACYTTSDEIARVVEAVRTIASCDE